MKQKMSPMDLLNSVKNKANLNNNTEKSIAVKLNKAGKFKFQLLALSEDYLFRARTQHAIATLPDNEDTNTKMIVIDCQGKDCPICMAASQFKNSGVTVDDINAAYKPKYPYTKLRNFLTGSEHFLVGVRVLADNAEEGTYLAKDEEIGSTQILQLSRAAFNSLMSAYEDFIEDNEDCIDELPPLFGIVDDSNDTIESLSISVRVATQPWSYNFTFGKATKVNKSDVNSNKLEFIKEGTKPSADYVDNAVSRIKEIQNYFTGAKILSDSDKETAVDTDIINNDKSLDDILDSDDLDSLL